MRVFFDGLCREEEGVSGKARFFEIPIAAGEEDAPRVASESDLASREGADSVWGSSDGAAPTVPESVSLARPGAAGLPS